MGKGDPQKQPVKATKPEKKPLFGVMPVESQKRTKDATGEQRSIAPKPRTPSPRKGK
jgi:hypothetical protein